VKKRKSWNRACYLKKKLRVLEVELAAAATIIAPASVAVAAPTAVATAAADPAAAAASSAAAAATLASAAAPDSWSVDTNGNMCTPVAQKMMKHWRVKPVMDNIFCAGIVQAQAAVLQAVADHPSLAPARKLASINSSKNAGSLQICLQVILSPEKD
jgi:hypothetical protein